MIGPIARYEYVIDAYLTDFRGKATLPMIGGYMLQAATKHAEERGFGYSYMTAEKRVWVLSRMAIELFEYPKNETVFVVKTWVADVNRLFTERYFSFENGEGTEIGFAKSLWASIDLETRKPTNVLDLRSMTDFIDKEKACPINSLTKIPLLKDEGAKVSSFEVKYSDVDINKHLNSMKYIEHFVDVFDIEMFREKDICRLEINYISEGKYGSTLDIVQKEVEDSVYILEMQESGSNVCTARLTWK